MSIANYCKTFIKQLYFYEIYKLKLFLQNVCNWIAHILQWIPEGYCTIVAINLQNLCRIGWFCKNDATTLQNYCSCFTRGIAKCLQSVCKIFAKFLHSYQISQNLFLHDFANNSQCCLGNGIKKFAKNLQRIGWWIFQQNLGRVLKKHSGSLRIR